MGELTFYSKSIRPKRTLYAYDSRGSYVLGVIAEKVSGKPFIEYMKDRVHRELGFSENATCIKTPEGYSWRAEYGRTCDNLSSDL